MTVRAWLRRHRYLALAAAIAVACALGVGVWWFKPHLLFIDDRVEHERPAEAQVLAEGAFRSLEHATAGHAVLVRRPDGRTLLRLEDLQTSNGPELRVMLSTIPAQDDWFVYDDGPHLDLGPLHGNIGSSNYEVPEGTDLSGYVSAVIWCKRFSVGFGVAPLARGE
jgi:hypothetical protein